MVGSQGSGWKARSYHKRGLDLIGSLEFNRLGEILVLVASPTMAYHVLFLHNGVFI